MVLLAGMLKPVILVYWSVTVNGFNQMKTELRFYRPLNFEYWPLEHDIVKGLDHIALVEFAEAAAIFL